MTDSTYTYQPGAVAASGKLRKATVSEVTNELLVHEAWEGVLGYDLFRDEPVVKNPPFEMAAETTGLLNADVTNMRAWFEVNLGLQVSKEGMKEAFEVACRTRAYHPVLDYLLTLPAWHAQEATDYLDELLGSALSIPIDEGGHIERIMVRKALIAACRRIMEPGCKVDNVLVLVGPQGAGKSSAIKALFDPWSKEDLAALDNKDALVGMRGVWAVEIAELQAVLRSDPAVVKSFVSRCVDKYRDPYETRATEHPRTTVFWGTTNEDDWLRDVTGERRWWPVRVSKVDLAWLQEHRDEIWSCAFTLAQLPVADCTHWLSVEEEALAEAHRDLFRYTDAAEQVVAGYLVGRGGKEISVHDVWSGVHPGSVGFAPPLEQQRIGRLLRKLGCQPKFTPGGFRKWRVPDTCGEEPIRKGLRVVSRAEVT